MQINSYLNFDGNCEVAFKRYAQIFGDKLDTMTFGSTPAGSGVPADWQNKLVHARLETPAGILMASDVPPGRFTKPAGFRVNINTKDPQKPSGFITNYQTKRPLKWRCSKRSGPNALQCSLIASARRG